MGCEGCEGCEGWWVVIVDCGCDGGLDESPKIGDGCASAGYGSRREARILRVQVT